MLASKIVSGWCTNACVSHASVQMYKWVSGRSASTSDPGDREKGSAIRNVSTPYATVTAIRFLCSAPMFTAGGQYNQSVGYRTPLETRVAKKTTKAITDFN